MPGGSGGALLARLDAPEVLCGVTSRYGVTLDVTLVGIAFVPETPVSP